MVEVRCSTNPHELGLLIDALQGHEPHAGSLDSLADCDGVRSVILATFARKPIGHDELGCDKSDDVAGCDEQTCPMMDTRASLHADRARRQSGDEFMQLGARHRRANEFGTAGLIDTVHRKRGLGEIDSDVDNGHGFPLPSELMRFATHRGTLLPIAAIQCDQLGTGKYLSFIRLHNQRRIQSLRFWLTHSRSKPKERLMGTSSVQCPDCGGRGYNSKEPEYSLVTYHVGCFRCGGSGRKAVSGHGTSKELRENTLRKGSGRITVQTDPSGSSKTIQTCRKCNGHGDHSATTTGLFGGEKLTRVKCKECNGTGRSHY